MQDTSSESFFQEKEIHLSEYLMVLMKRRTLIILVFILTVLATAFYSFSVDPVYESSARLIRAAVRLSRVSAPTTNPTVIIP